MAWKSLEGYHLRLDGLGAVAYQIATSSLAVIQLPKLTASEVVIQLPTASEAVSQLPKLTATETMIQIPKLSVSKAMIHGLPQLAVIQLPHMSASEALIQLPQVNASEAVIQLFQLTASEAVTGVLAQGDGDEDEGPSPPMAVHAVACREFASGLWRVTHV
mmetsp:Transcript_5364/g.12204  ORF Transcript_5364/g.12204 Transcript_5364/m.12204 type:complete len:161 (+) Transcript_5364:297-779(+)